MTDDESPPGGELLRWTTMKINAHNDNSRKAEQLQKQKVA